jgi:hypothetical protein
MHESCQFPAKSRNYPRLPVCRFLHLYVHLLYPVALRKSFYEKG